MNIIANNVASKLFVAFVAAAMLFTLAAPSAKAATAEELQAQIAALMAQIAALQGSSSATSAAACTFTGALTIGSTGAEVKCLQDYLTPTYFKNAGGSTGTFGPITAAAVAAWQSANGVTPAAGYFGPVSQAKYKALVAATPADDSSTDGDTTTGGDTTSSDLSGEASINTTDIDSADDDTIEEGAEEVQLGTLNIEFQDGDAKITRLDVNLSATGEEDGWDTFDEVSLVVDGDVVATIDSSDKDNWQDDDTTLRFSGLDIVAMEDEEANIEVVATVANSVDNLPATWNLDVTSIRFVDADDVTSTETVTAASVSVTLDQAGGDDEVIVKTSSSDPDATTLELKDDAKSSWYTAFAFDIDTKDSTNDVTLNEVPVTVAVSSSTFDALVDDYELVIDGVTVDTLKDNNGVTAGNYTDGASVTLTFNVDGDVVVDAGDRVKAELKLRFKSLALGNEGVTVQGSVTGGNVAAIDAEGADTLTGTQLSGSATGDAHTLRTSGLFVSDFSSDVNVTTSDTADNSYGEFVLTFDVTALGSDEVYVPLTAGAFDGAAASANKGAVYKITDSANSAVASSSADSLSASLVRVSGGDTSTSGYVRLDGGDTATLKLTVTFNPGTAAAQYIATLQSAGFAATAVPATSQTTASPATDYDTDPTYIAS